MKHLRGFNERVEANDILEDVKDIFLELEDMGFKIEYLPFNGFDSSLLRVTINHPGRSEYSIADVYLSFTYKQIKEYVLRLMDYLVVNAKGSEVDIEGGRADNRKNYSSHTKNIKINPKSKISWISDNNKYSYIVIDIHTDPKNRR